MWTNTLLACAHAVNLGHHNSLSLCFRIGELLLLHADTPSVFLLHGAA